MMNMKVLTLTGSAQQLHTAVGVLLQDDRTLWLSIQPDTANASPAYIGNSATTSSSNCFVRLEAAAATVPPAPWQISEAIPGPAATSSILRLSDLYVIGANGEKLHIGWIPAV